MKAVSLGFLLSCLALSCALGCGEGEPPPVDRDPPVIIEAYKSSATVAHGGTITFRLTVQDAPDTTHEFSWKTPSGVIGAPTTLATSSEVSWTAPNCVFVDTPVTIQASVTNSWGLSAHKVLTVTVLEGCLSWLNIPPMSVQRTRHLAQLLPSSGKVLVTGGTSNTAELYDPATNSWAPTGSSALTRGAAVLLPSGKVLAVGGYGTLSAELYDPATGTWTPDGAAEPEPTEENPGIPHGGSTVSLLPSGKVLVTGSVVEAGAELYDPVTHTWTPTGNMIKLRTRHTVSVLPSGKVLVAGGHDGLRYLNSTELYDPATNTWSAGPSMASAHSEHTASVLPSGKVLIAGTIGSAPLSAELYDPGTNTWSLAGTMNFPRRFHTANVLPSGKVLVVGGLGEFPSFSYLTKVELYDPATNIWTVVGQTLEGRTDHTATLLPSLTVLILGGVHRDGLFDNGEACDLIHLP